MSGNMSSNGHEQQNLTRLTPDRDEDESLLEPIAICGLAFKFPQDATSVEAFWKMLVEKRNAMTDYPNDRLNIAGFFNPSRQNSLNSRGGHFIAEDLGYFDADFFSIKPSDAAAMDPMQRLLLETTFHALENAGVRLEDVWGSRTSVHTGCFSNDYFLQLLRDADRLPRYAAVGAAQTMLANRISWFFDLRGASYNVDSACSSSAVAVDHACQMLRSGSVDMSIAAGSNLILDPDYSTILSNMHILSPDSRCYAFDHRANGYSRGEGIGVIVLKRLSDAIRDNDTIRAVIRASGSNQDGYTPGVTQPSQKAQAQLIRETYGKAGLTMRHTRFIEAHGTGTRIGDPIEIAAIADCFRHYRDSSSPLYVGAVKTNIGHLEGASGIAGLIKAIIVAETGIVPPNANFEKLEQRLAAYDSFIAMPTSPIEAWPCSLDVRRVSLHSFGFGGTNCHIVIDDTHSYLRRHQLQGNHRTLLDPATHKTTIGHHQRFDLGMECTSPSLHTPKLLCWSASNEQSLKQLLANWESYFRIKGENNEPSWLDDVAYTLDSRRSSFLWKSYAVVSSSSDLKRITQSVSEGRPSKSLAPRLAFVFTGQGAQWHGMARELLVYPEFLNVVMEAESLYQTLGCAWSVQEELLMNEHEYNINSPHISQALTAIIQIGLVDLLRSFRVKPVAVVGHSMGEIAAAYCAGFFDRISALKLAFHRGSLVSSIQTRENNIKGAMLAVALSEIQIQQYFELLRCQTEGFNLVIGCINSPSNVTVSGNKEHIEKLECVLQKDNIFTTRLKTPVAYHSSQMKTIAKDCLQVFDCLQVAESSSSSSSNVRMISSVTGDEVSGERAREASYWVANMLSPVLFSQAIQRLCRDSIGALRKKIDGSHGQAIVVDCLIEIGPRAALRLPIQENIDIMPRGCDLTYLPSLIHNRPADLSLLQLLGNLHCRGFPVDIRRVNDPRHDSSAKNCINLTDTPAYPFDHSTKFWAESPLSRNYRLRPYGYVELLGTRARDWNPLAPEWRCYVQVTEMPWLLDNTVNGKSIYPASAMICMALKGASQLVDDCTSITGFTLRNVRFQSIIPISSSSTDLETRLRLNPIKSNLSTQHTAWCFTVYSVAAGIWSENCGGTLQVHYQENQVTEHSPKRMKTWLEPSQYQDCWDSREQACTYPMNASDVYANFKRCGFDYGSSFQGICTVAHDRTTTVVGSICLNRPLSISVANAESMIHPASLDSFMQLALLTLDAKGSSQIPTQEISAIDRIWISNEGLYPSDKSILASARLDLDTPRNKTYSVFGLSADNQHLRLVLEGLQTTTILSPSSPNNARYSMNSISGIPNVSSNEQFWYTFRTRADVDMIPADVLLKRLDCICGPDVSGPKQFTSALRAYLYLKMQEIKESLSSKSFVPEKLHLRQYMQWIDWQLSKSDEMALPPTESNSCLRSRIEEQGQMGRFFLQVADNALNVLRGSVDIVQLLFTGNNVESFYRNQSFGSIYYQKLAVYLNDLSFKHPNMTILEVGAGTGSFTDHILNALSGDDGARNFAKYYFTDISPAFFERAQKQFEKHKRRMDFTILDIEKDPVEQGFEQGAFDMIVASNVLHVTADLERTLRGLRRLLKRGGKLILHEVVRPDSIPTSFVFGLLPGWWPATEDGRSMSPVVDEARWDTLLRLSGFSGADLRLRDYADQESHLMSIICATAEGSGEDKNACAELAVVVEPGSSLQQDLAEAIIAQLSTHGFHATRIITLSADSVQEGIVSRNSAIVTLFDAGEKALLSRLDNENFPLLKHLLLSSRNILWVSNGGGRTPDPSHGMIDGFAKVFNTEQPQSKLTTLALEGFVRETSQASTVSNIVSVLIQVLRNAANPNELEDYRMLEGVLHINRIQTDAAMSQVISGKKTETKTLEAARPFTLELQDSSLLIRQDECTDAVLQVDDVEIEVRAIGLGADESSLLREYSETEPGREYAGVITRTGSHSSLLPGYRVCAYSPDLPRSNIQVRETCLVRIPDSVSFVEAATLPRDLLTVSHLVQRVISICKEDVVLIHGGHTRVAKLVINQLTGRGYKILVTVPTMEDRNNLQKLFGGVTICVSMSGSCFPAGCATVVVDFTSTSDISDLAQCVSPFGQIISIAASTHNAKKDILSLPANISFKLIDMEQVFRSWVHDQPQMPSQYLVDRSVVDALPEVQSFSLANASSGVLIPANAGKEARAVIELDNRDVITVTSPINSSYSFDRHSAYLVAGGLGGLGKSIVQWMVSRGACHLILLSRSGPRTEDAKTFIHELEEKGTWVYAPACDISDKSALQDVMLYCSDKMPPIKGCIQATAVLKDITYEKMTLEDWTAATKSKVQGSWNLHSLLPQKLDFFILASSMTGVLGQATQINYAAGNTFQDALARYRLSIGEKAVSLDLGIISTSGLGLLAAREDLVKRLKSTGLYSPLTQSEIVSLFEYFCDPCLDLERLPSQVASGIVPPSLHAGRDIETPATFRQPLWSHTLYKDNSEDDSTIDPASDTSRDYDNRRSIHTALTQAHSIPQIREIITGALADRFCRLTLTPQHKLDVDKPLHAAGADSLTAVDLRSWIVKEFSVDVPVFDILGDMSIAALCNQIAAEWWKEAKRTPPP
ncbi:polyketide synthase, putative [Talaromyces marneffei ATCC 18224]|uniref:Polyketide synthase, putative n=2 Tax=Talaromyces marneffei TaxID=37727 RepID=B6Q8D7_TALMQ|nr:putative polyketide synthase PKS6 [Talaromyces marneffei]EEA25741.1 polyketide synthase, putative [Talaromyces marneffei ATCC 18224]